MMSHFSIGMMKISTLVLLSNSLLCYFVTATYYRTPAPKVTRKPSTCQNDVQIIVSAYFDMNGIRGNVQFYQPDDSDDVTINVNLEGLDQYPDERWMWEIHEQPITNALLREEPCSSSIVGNLYDPTGATNSADYEEDCARDSSLCAVGDLTGHHGPLLPNETSYQFTNNMIDLFHDESFVGRTVVLRRGNEFRFACANIEYDAIDRVETYVAHFPFDPLQQDNTVQGEIVLRRPRGRCGVTLDANLFLVDGSSNTMLGWSLRRGQPGAKGDCSDLEDVYGSNTFHIPDYSTSCADHHRNCYIGDLNNKCGRISSNSVGFRNFCTDTQLAVVDQSEINDLAIAVEDDNGTVIACSVFSEWMERGARAYMYDRDTRVFIDILFYQTDPHDDTFVRAYINGLEPDRCYLLQIRQRAVTEDTQRCADLGPVYEPRANFVNRLPVSGVIQTGDKDFLGDLTNKVPRLCGDSLYAFTVRTAYLPLFWEYDILDRSLVIFDQASQVDLACANIVPFDSYDLTRISLTGYH